MVHEYVCHVGGKIVVKRKERPETLRPVCVFNHSHLCCYVLPTASPRLFAAARENQHVGSLTAHTINLWNHTAHHKVLEQAIVC